MPNRVVQMCTRIALLMIRQIGRRRMKMLVVLLHRHSRCCCCCLIISIALLHHRRRHLLLMMIQHQVICVARRNLVASAQFRAEAVLAVLFGLHPAILKPYLYLTLRQRQRTGNLNATLSRQVLVRVKLLLQLERLEARVRLPRALTASATSIYTQ